MVAFCKKTNEGTRSIRRYKMATQYFRITGYHPTENFCFIVDSHGMFDKMWQFSSFLVKKGIKVIEVSNDEQFIDIDLKKVDFNSSELILRATGKGHPDFTEKVINGVNRKVVIVGGKSYIP